MATISENRETAGLIGSDKVEGTNVYGAGEEKIGSIERVMIGKTDGKVAYAVLSFGGFLGMGDEHFPRVTGLPPAPPLPDRPRMPD